MTEKGVIQMYTAEGILRPGLGTATLEDSCAEMSNPLIEGLMSSRN